MTDQRIYLHRTPNGWTNGNLTVIHQSYLPVGQMRWLAVWKDLFNGQREIREYTRERLAQRLKPYGMDQLKFGR
jgi:hypothetical protein